MMIDSLSLLWVRHVAFVYLKLSSKAHGGGFVLSKPRQFVSSEANIEVSSFSCWSPSSLISPLCNKDTIWKCPPIQHCEWVCTIHVEGEHQATCVHPPAPLPRLTPQPTSREARHISEHKRSVSVTLEIRSPWSARTTHQDWRRLRSTWSRGIFYRVLKDIVTVTYLQFQFINKICVLLFYLSKTVGPPQKIRKIYAISDFAFFLKHPVGIFNI